MKTLEPLRGYGVYRTATCRYMIVYFFQIYFHNIKYCSKNEINLSQGCWKVHEIQRQALTIL